MKKYFNRLISAVLTLVMLIVMIPMMSMEAKAVSENDVLDFLAVTKASINKSKSDLGLTSDWCCKFVGYCINQSSLSDSLGTVKYDDVANPIRLACWICRDKEAGTIHSFSPSHSNRLKDDQCRIPAERILDVSMNDFTPEPGDIVFFSWSQYSWEKHVFSHVGIVSEVDTAKKRITYIDGNSESDGGNYTYVKSHTRSYPSDVIWGYLRFDTCEYHGKTKQADGSYTYQTIKKTDGTYAAVCKYCGAEYPITVDNSTAGIYKVTQDIILNSAPYAEAQNGIKAAKNKEFTVIGSTINAYGSLWYQTREGYWIYESYLNYVSSLPGNTIVSVAEGIYYIEAYCGKVVEVEDSKTSNKANVQIWNKSTRDLGCQKFNITKTGNYYTLSAVHSGKLVDVADGSSASGTNIWQYTANGTDAQKWQFEDAGGGYYYIRSALGTYMEVKNGGTENGTNIWANSFTGTDAQKFKLVSLSASIQPNDADISADDIVSVALSLVDQYPYVSGGESPEEGGFDCTGLVYYIYHTKLGMSMTLDQARSKSKLLGLGTKITNKEDLLPGDVLQMEYSTGPHVVIYIGNNQIVEAAKPGTMIRQQSFSNIASGFSYGIRFPQVKQSGSTTLQSHTLTMKYNTNGGKIRSETYSIASSGIVIKGSSEVIANWTYGSGHENGLYNASTFGLYRDGYTFVGWSLSPDGNERVFDQDDNTIKAETIYPNLVNEDATITLYAIWEEDTSTAPNSGSSRIVFPPIADYVQGQFTDVLENQWFTNSVADAFEFGLMKGNSATTFNPYGNVTLAETITMASRIHSIYSTGTESFDQKSGGAWYQTYLDYAYSNGIIGSDYYYTDVTVKATRAQFAEIFSNSLPDEALPPISSVSDDAIPDVKMTDPCAQFVYRLYRAGILTGGDVKGTFSPLSYITRAEAAAIISRIADSDNRVKFTLALS